MEEARQGKLHLSSLVVVGIVVVSGNILVFVCHVTLQDHVIRALYDFMVSSPSR